MIECLTELKNKQLTFQISLIKDLANSSKIGFQKVINLLKNMNEDEVKICVELYPPVKGAIILYYWLKDEFPTFENCETCIEPDFVSQKNYE